MFLLNNSLLGRKKRESESHKKESYAAIHNKFKIDYRNKQFKNVYDKLVKMDEPEGIYRVLFLEDIIISLTKMLRESMLRKEMNTNGLQSTFISLGKQKITQLYRLFLADKGFISNDKVINDQMQNRMSRFLAVTINFNYKMALAYSIQNKISDALKIHEINHFLCLQVMTSSTSKYKLLRTISQSLLCYSAFLIDCSQFEKGIQILLQVLRNEVNILMILENRSKNRKGKEKKRIKMESFNRIFAIFFNLAICCQSKQKTHLTYLCLQECRVISIQKDLALQQQPRINWNDHLRYFRSAYLEYNELLVICSTYFDEKKVRQEANRIYKNELIVEREQSDVVVSFDTIIDKFKKNAKEQARKEKRPLRRSVSLQGKLDRQNHKRLYKDFGQEFLFFGTNLFEKPKTISTIKTATTAFKATKHSMVQDSPSSNHFENFDAKPKLKKKYKKVQFDSIRKPQQHLEFSQLQTKFKDLWKKQTVDKNKHKENICLLRYKSQFLNYKQLHDENINSICEIQPCNTKQIDLISKVEERMKIKEEEKQKDKGINLFKKLLLRHSKDLDIKKSEMINLLRRQNKNTSKDSILYSSPNDSINYLLQNLKKSKEKNMKSQPTQPNQSAREYQNIFLTKDTVEIPNLFLSYITSSSSKKYFLNLILDYGFQLVDDK